MSVCEMYKKCPECCKVFKVERKKNTFAFKPNVRTVVK